MSDADRSEAGVVDADGRPPSSVRDAFKEAENVTGAEFSPPTDLDGYLDEPRAKFGLWVGESEDDAELLTFEIEGDQIDGLADAFQRLADDAADLTEE